MAELNNLLIAGGHGLIGAHLDFGIKPVKSEFDVTDYAGIEKACRKYSPSGILCLANVNLRMSEQNPFEAYKVNTLGVYNLAKAAEKRKIPLILISTGAVFFGDSAKSFSEDDLPAPQNIYGQAKYLAEIFALGNPKNLVVRTGWVFGSYLVPEKKNVFDRMLDLIIEEKEVKATNDQYGSPVYIKDLISELKKLIISNASGIYHVVNSGKASAFEFAEEASLYTNSKSKINRVSVKDFISDVKRSPSEYLISKKIQLRPWKDALRECLSLRKRSH